MWANQGNLTEETASEMIGKYWAPRVKDSITIMKPLRNGSGIAFDLRSDLADGFMENFDMLKEQNSRRVDFSVIRCTTKPDVEQEQKRNNYDNGNSGRYNNDRGYGGGSGGNSYGGSRGGGGNDRRGGGGYNGGQGGYNGGGSKSWGGGNSGNTGGNSGGWGNSGTSGWNMNGGSGYNNFEDDKPYQAPREDNRSTYYSTQEDMTPPYTPNPQP